MTALTAFAIVLVCGCEYTAPGPPYEYPTVRVSGQVTANGRPVPGGWISFHPAGSVVGDLTIAAIDSEGRYVADLCPVGPLQVRIDFNEPARRRLREIAMEQPIVAQMLAARLPHVGGMGSRLRFTTQAEGENRYDVDLMQAEVGG